MDPQDQVRTEVKELLVGVPQSELTELCIQALRAWRVGKPDHEAITMHGALGLELVPLLAARKGITVTDREWAIRLKEAFHAQEQPWMLGVVEFLWWMVRAGLAIPIGDSTRSYQYPATFRLTSAGLSFFDRIDDHPLLPGAIDRARNRCPGLPVGVVDLLGDSRRCLEHCLFRPAVVVMGVAYEEAIDAVIDALDTRHLLSAKAALAEDAVKRLKRVAALLEQALPGAANSEARRAAAAAYDFADALRRRRNDAAHTRPKYGFEDRAEIEDLLVAAVRHLPGLWSPAIEP